jgi:superfamily II DNA/RNA helicase
LKDSELKTEDVLNKKINTPKFIDSARALIISPTRELAVQISDMIKAVIPE